MQTRINDDTPLSFLTVGQLRQLISEMLVPPQPRYKKGIAGLMEIFSCSHTTADRIKRSGVIDLAIKQTQKGGAFYTDADLALRIYKQKLTIIENGQAAS